jgi:uncharacterized protein (TIGR00251 family)
VALLFNVKVIPNSGKNKWNVDSAGTLKCYLKSAPEQGRANNELIQTLSKLLGIACNQIMIVVGQTSRKKIIKVNTAITYQELMHKLGIEKQLTLFVK